MLWCIAPSFDSGAQDTTIIPKRNPKSKCNISPTRMERQALRQQRLSSLFRTTKTYRFREITNKPDYKFYILLAARPSGTALKRQILRDEFDLGLEPIAFDIYTGWLLTRRAQAYFAVSSITVDFLVQYNLKITTVICLFIYKNTRIKMLGYLRTRFIVMSRIVEHEIEILKHIINVEIFAMTNFLLYHLHINRFQDQLIIIWIIFTRWLLKKQSNHFST